MARKSNTVTMEIETKRKVNKKENVFPIYERVNLRY